MTIPPALLDAIFKYVEPAKNLKSASDAIDRHRGFFVYRRADFINRAYAAIDPQALKDRVKSEYGQMDAYLAGKVKAFNPKAGGTDVAPPHLDLHDLAQPKATTGTSEINKNESTYRAKRTYRVQAIGWRAAARDELWKGSADGHTSALLKDALDEVLDRRLHLVERMNFQVSRAEVLGGSWSFSGGGPLGPWKDGFRIRMFEYPRIPTAGLDQAVKFIGAANIAAETQPEFASSDPAWRWEAGHKRLLFNVGPSPGIWFPPRVRSDWKADPKLTYFQDLAPPANTPAAAIDQLFTPTPDWWERSWLYCDHVISALHLEALLFALRRRYPAHGEKDFNDLVTHQAVGFVSLGSFVATTTAHNLGRLMAMGDVDPMSNGAADPYFDNLVVDESDLQIGDHLIFYNSRIFSLISKSEWSLENSVVIDIASDPATGGIQRSALRLQGHGTAEKDYASYLLEIVQPFNEALGQVRDAIKKAIARDAGVKKLDWNGNPELLVWWDPYDYFDAPGAWWIKVLLLGPDGTPASLSDSQAAFTGSIVVDPAPGPGYVAPPSKAAVYFPLFSPAFPKGWAGYLDARRSKADLKVPRKLKDFVADGSITPGLFYKGQGQPIPVLRPKVTP